MHYNILSLLSWLSSLMNILMGYGFDSIWAIATPWIQALQNILVNPSNGEVLAYKHNGSHLIRYKQRQEARRKAKIC